MHRQTCSPGVPLRQQCARSTEPRQSRSSRRANSPSQSRPPITTLSQGLFTTFIPRTDFDLGLASGPVERSGLPDDHPVIRHGAPKDQRDDGWRPGDQRALHHWFESQ